MRFLLLLCLSFGWIFSLHSESRIGILTELTGNNASNGADCVAGIRAAINSFRPGVIDRLPVVFGDHGGDAKLGVTEFQRMIREQRAIGIIGNRSQIFMALNPIAVREKIPLVGIVGHPRFLIENPMAVRSYPSVELESEPLAAFVRSRNLKKVASLTVEDEWTLALTDAFWKHLEHDSVEHVFEAKVPPTEFDFRALAAKVVRSSPDVVLLNFTISQSGSLLRQLREAGYRGKILSNFWSAHPDAIAAAGAEAASELYFSTIDVETPGFLALLRSASPRATATALSYCCFVSEILVMQACVESVCDTPEDLSRAIQTVGSVKLPDRSLKIVNREVQFPVILKRFDKGREVRVLN